MNKKILIGSIIAVVILLLMPSISAIQYVTLQDISQKNNDEFEEELNKKNIEYLPDPPKDSPLLFLLVSSIIICRLIRYYWLFEWSTEPGGIPREYNIIHPLLYARSTILLLKTGLWITGWEGIANYFGWDWKFILP